MRDGLTGQHVVREGRHGHYRVSGARDVEGFRVSEVVDVSERRTERLLVGDIVQVRDLPFATRVGRQVELEVLVGQRDLVATGRWRARRDGVRDARLDRVGVHVRACDGCACKRDRENRREKDAHDLCSRAYFDRREVICSISSDAVMTLEFIS